MKYLLIIFLFCASNIKIFAFESIAKNKFETEFNIQIILKDTFHSSFDSIYYTPIEKLTKIDFYIKHILTYELKKYPKDYFKNINLNQIVLCKKLKVNKQYRAAIPDPYKKTLLLSIDESYDTLYLKHVLHHEIHHIAEYALWQNMFYDWKKWQRKNTRNFVYGLGGFDAYETKNKAMDWYVLNHPKVGFVNLYSTLGQEEDRCEIVALLMTDEERIRLNQFSKKDKFLKRKIMLILKMLTKISKSKKIHWLKILRNK